MKITKGVFELRDNKIFKTGNSSTIGQTYVIENYNKLNFKPVEDVEANANGALWVEAQNVANESGLTPRQLLNERNELLRILNTVKI